MTPRQARTQAHILGLKRDNIASEDFSLIVDEDTVSISGRNGEDTTIPRENFDFLIDWYNGVKP